MVQFCSFLHNSLAPPVVICYMKVLVIMGHPRKDSYCAALADSYIRGARDGGTQVKSLILSDLSFEAHVLVPSPQYQHMEPDLLHAQELILWADHIVFVFPTWWGNMPALLKGFLDRVLTPGYAFRELQPDAFERKLAPRSAQIISTMDTPIWVDRLINGAPAIHALSEATLKFCGIRPVRRFLLSPIKHSTPEQKEAWLQDVYQLGLRMQQGVLKPREKLIRQVKPWIQAIRLQFYPMTFFAYGIGALAYARPGNIDWLVFLLGYLLLFLLEIIVVFSNDYHDRETDQLNRYFSPFTGGSRVLIEGSLDETDLRTASKNLLFFCLPLTLLIAHLAEQNFLTVALLVGTLFLIAVAYTAPPIKFSYRGWGEIVVGFTHSFAVILCGYVFQGGSLGSPLPWLVGIPLFCSIVPAIILAGFPDREADQQVGKKTLAVRMGKEKASKLAAGFVALSLVSLFYFKYIPLQHSFPFAHLYPDIFFITLLHGLIYMAFLIHYSRQRHQTGRIDYLLLIGLTYILWFALVPFIVLLIHL